MEIANKSTFSLVKIKKTKNPRYGELNTWIKQEQLALPIASEEARLGHEIAARRYSNEKIENPNNKEALISVSREIEEADAKMGEVEKRKNALNAAMNEIQQTQEFLFSWGGGVTTFGGGVIGAGSVAAAAAGSAVVLAATDNIETVTTMLDTIANDLG